jgi:hypothetical protein
METVNNENKNTREEMNTNNYKELFTALAKAQSEFKVAKRNTNGYNYKYADICELVRVSRPALTKNGLSVIQLTIQGKSGDSKTPMILKTMLCHSSGQFIESNINVVSAVNNGPSKPSNILQALGTSLTYLKRYSYSSMIGVVVDGEDSDGVTPSSSGFTRR